MGKKLMWNIFEAMQGDVFTVSLMLTTVNYTKICMSGFTAYTVRVQTLALFDMSSAVLSNG